MGRRLTRRMWWGLAAFAPLPLLGFSFLALGHAGIEPASSLIFKAELWLSGTGADYSNRITSHVAAKPLPTDAAILFSTSAKGPRADQYQIVKTTTYAGKQTISASIAGMPDITGSIQAVSQGAVRDKKGDRLNPPVTEVALRGSVDAGDSAALFMSSPGDLNELEAAFNAGRPAPSAQAIAYHPSQEGLAFKSAGESQAEFEERERRCLSTAIYFEARGEPVRGQIAVAQVNARKCGNRGTACRAGHGQSVHRRLGKSRGIGRGSNGQCEHGPNNCNQSLHCLFFLCVCSTCATCFFVHSLPCRVLNPASFIICATDL